MKKKKLSREKRNKKEKQHWKITNTCLSTFFFFLSLSHSPHSPSHHNIFHILFHSDSLALALFAFYMYMRKPFPIIIITVSLLYNHCWILSFIVASRDNQITHSIHGFMKFTKFFNGASLTFSNIIIYLTIYYANEMAQFFIPRHSFVYGLFALPQTRVRERVLEQIYIKIYHYFYMVFAIAIVSVVDVVVKEKKTIPLFVYRWSTQIYLPPKCWNQCYLFGVYLPVMEFSLHFYAHTHKKYV